MKKLGLLVCTASALVLAACGTVASQLKDLPERDARIIVEVDKNINKLSEEGAKRTQLAVYNNIKAAATSNIRMLDSYTVLNNAFVIEVNSQDIESIKSVPGVKSVTVDKMHWEREINNDSYVVLDGDEGNDAIDESKNISAETMHLPEDNNEGEGTVVAILDNEFHLRGELRATSTQEAAPAWNHEVFNPLDDDVAVRYTFASIKGVTGLKALKRSPRAKAGQEESEYFNNKVPFYFDYGGDSKIYGKRGELDYDVHSDLSYHGSHVSSITAANAPSYKGIAPKAQLVLMKVFTDYNAKGLGQKLGLSNRTGAYDTSILDALEDCIKLKVDGINMSLGSDLDDFDGDSITLKTLTRLAKGDPENGVPAILTSISAGNSGKSSYSSSGAYANWMPESVETGIMSSYANNAAVMTIASGHPTKIFYENAFSVGDKNIAFDDQIVNRPGLDDDYDKEFRIKDIFESENSQVGWQYVPGFGTAADYKGLDVEGKIAVVNRGSTAFADKYAVAADKGAIALVIINNDPTASYFNFRCSFGDGFNPTMPCALVLYKDKVFFETTDHGSFGLINKKVSDNPAKYTVSDFSTDGATFDLDLKPEITAPGDNIRGAVPEHAMTNLTAEERQSPEYLYKCYQYLSGTSMSAPNYAGAQSVVLSSKTAPIYRAAKAENNRKLTDDELTEINDYRETVDMRLMSTADPMKDYVANPESSEETFSVTSPRIQGAGMVDLNGALNTKVYLEGLDLNGNTTRKAKIALRTSEDVAKGNLNLKFVAHNESEETKNYDVTLTVMRPAIAKPNDVVTKEYNYRGTVESIEYFSGMRYYDPDLGRMMTAPGSVAFKDALKVDKDIEYYASEEDYEADQDDIFAGLKESRKTIIKKGYYYNSATGGVCWEPLPSYNAQSTRDVEIDRVTGQTVTVKPGYNTITLNPYSLPKEEKDKILEVYEYGCMIEGYVTLTDKDANGIDLSIPYLGFYAGADRNPGASYEKAPVTEPFNFEKDPTKVYPSDLVNDLAKSLIGKDKANLESMIVAGYAESPQKINIDQVLENDLAFDGLTGFYKVGSDPIDDEYVEDAKNNIYVGSGDTNTMIIQQFMLRSVAENYFTITNKETGETIYTSVLEDMLYGDSANKWALHKSHVDFINAYVACRAYAIVPLFDEVTGEKFPSGEYELTFNYQLAATKNWVSKSYNLHIDSEAPQITSISQYKLVGVDRVRIYLQDTKLSYGIVGYNRVDLNYDTETKQYYIDEEKEFIDECIEEISEDLESKRLFIGAVDFARGKTGCVVHFNDYNNFMAGYEVVQGTGITVNNDYTLSNDNKLSFINVNTGASVDVEGDIRITKFAATGVVDGNPTAGKPSTTIDLPEATASAKSGCNGALASLSLTICIPALLGTSLLFFKKRKGGK